MPLKVGLDGIGPINRGVLAAAAAGGFADVFEVAVIASSADAPVVHDRLARDSVYGVFPARVALDNGKVTVGESSVTILQSDASAAPDWSAQGIDVVVVDGTLADEDGRAARHLERGARKVVIAGRTAPGAMELLPGVDTGGYDPDRDHIVATGRPSTMAAAVLVAAISRVAGARSAHVDIVRPPDDRDGWLDLVDATGHAVRAATGLAHRPEAIEATRARIESAVGGRVTMREMVAPVVPVGRVLAIVTTEQPKERSALATALVEESQTVPLAGLLGTRPSVESSHDVVLDSRSIVVDLGSIEMLGDQLVLVCGWYDAIWAASCRTADLLAYLYEAGVPGTA